MTAFVCFHPGGGIVARPQLWGGYPDKTPLKWDEIMIEPPYAIWVERTLEKITMEESG